MYRGGLGPTPEPLCSCGPHRGRLKRRALTLTVYTHNQITGRQLVLRMVGGESRKSRRPSAASESKTSVNFHRNSPRKIRRISPWKKSETASENTKLKGRMRLIARNVSNKVTCESKPGMSLLPRMITISENKGDVMVEKTSTRVF